MYERQALYKMKHSGIYILLLLLIQSCAFSQDEKKVVYITKTGEKYHTESCRYLKYSSFEIDFEEANERGYTACSVCKPGEGDVKNDTVKPAAPKPQTSLKANTVQKTQSTTTRQCSALTKAGTRCKRTTSEANGKCWQHQ